MRCTSCSASWRAFPEELIDLEDELEDEPEEELEYAAIDAGPTPPASVDEDLFERPVAELPADELPKAFRARAETERKVREAAVHGAIWAAMGAAFALIITTALVFRIDIVRIWPRTASAYAGIGMPVNFTGLTIENVKASPGLQDGHASLMVTGVMRNIRAKPIAAPPLSITLLDKSGKPMLARTVTPEDPLVPAGQTRSFSVSLLDPPTGATDLEVEFLLGRTRRSPRPAATPVSAAAPPILRSAAPKPQALGPAPTVEEARPLPPSSPYALSGDSGGAAAHP